MREEFMRELYEKHFELVYKYCLSKLRHDEDAAAEVAHAVFEAAGEKYESLREHPNKLGWLMQTAKHMIRRRWTRSAKEAAKNIPLELVTALPDGRDPFDSVELTEGDIKRITAEVLSGLSPGEREIYELFYRRKLTYAETAASLGVSEKAARARLARVKAKLTKRIIYFLGE